jgi:hypothetical protein
VKRTLPIDLRWLWLCVALTPLGCTGASVPAGTEDRLGPHRGVLLALPDDQGFAEVIDEVPAGARQVGRAQTPSRIFVYLLNPELSAPASVSPSTMTMRVTVVTGSPQAVPLEPEPDAADPLGKNRFASKPGPYGLREAEGELSAELGGSTWQASFDGSRLGR